MSLLHNWNITVKPVPLKLANIFVTVMGRRLFCTQENIPAGALFLWKHEKWACFKIQVILCKTFPNVLRPPRHSTLEFGYLLCARSSDKCRASKCEQDTKIDALRRVQKGNNPVNQWFYAGSWSGHGGCSVVAHTDHQELIEVVSLAP